MELRKLEELLGRYKIPYQEWGAEGRKDIDDLLAEIAEGETILSPQSGELVRSLTCVQVDVFYQSGAGRRYLVESHQIVRGQRRERKRGASLYEKLKGDENPYLCAHRALSEELQIAEPLYGMHALAPIHETMLSTSFRGLETKYTFYPFTITLTKEHYKPEGYVDMSEEPREVTYFVWQDL